MIRALGGSIVIDLYVEVSGQFLRLPYYRGLGLPSEAVRVRMVTVAKVKDMVPEAAEVRRCADKVKDCRIWRLERYIVEVLEWFTLWFIVMMITV